MTRLTGENIEMLLEQIVDAVENYDDRDDQFYAVRTILEDEGIIEEVP